MCLQSNTHVRQYLHRTTWWGDQVVVLSAGARRSLTHTHCEHVVGTQRAMAVHLAVAALCRFACSATERVSVIRTLATKG